jgi:hypothetical protein
MFEKAIDFLAIGDTATDAFMVLIWAKFQVVSGFL